jgi:transcriptional regulator with XRE-family HTH domain
MPAKQIGRGSAEKILSTHRENIGIPVVLLDSVIEVTDANSVSTAIPDLKGLEAAAAIARISIPTKLGGKEIKFIRRVLGKRAIDIARRLDISPEHISRIEGGSTALITNTERIFRWDVLCDLKRKAPLLVVKDEEILNMTFSAVRRSVRPVTLVFTRVMLPSDSSHKGWRYDGVEHPEGLERATA